MPYLVRLADRALRDMEAIYEFIAAEASESAFAWFNDLAREIYSLERFPERGAVTRESKKPRHLLFGKKPSTYRIIYVVGKRNEVVNVLHIRHGARAALSTKEVGKGCLRARTPQRSETTRKTLARALGSVSCSQSTFPVWALGSLRSRRHQGAGPLTRLPTVALDCGFAAGVIRP
jgi:toxin ParE1/3/4